MNVSNSVLQVFKQITTTMSYDARGVKCTQIRCCNQKIEIGLSILVTIAKLVLAMADFPIFTSLALKHIFMLL